MPQVHGAEKVGAFGICLPSGHCRAVERQTTTEGTGFLPPPTVEAVLSLVCSGCKRLIPSLAVNMVGASAKPSVVATVHICGAVEPSSILQGTGKIKG